MREYTTQMDAARRGIITPEMKAVAKKEYRSEEEIRDLGKRTGSHMREQAAYLYRTERCRFDAQDQDKRKPRSVT